MVKLKIKRQKETKIDIDDEGTDQDAVTFQINSYGADYDIRGLVSRVKEEELELPDFQRGNVWKLSQKSLLIDSFLRGLPVPGIFLSRDPVTHKFEIIDGQQRLQTLLEFYENYLTLRGKKIHPDYRGCKYSTLPAQYRRKLDNALLHATIIESKDLRHSGIHDLFSRINTSSTPLNAQEMRTALNGGPLNDALKNLNENINWRAAFGKEHSRIRDREFILRFLSLTYNLENYKPAMPTFLDYFMAEHRFDSEDLILNYKDIFEQAISKLVCNAGQCVFKPKKAFVITVFDALSVGMAKAILAKKDIPSEKVVERIQILQTKNFEYLYGIEKFTSDKDRINARINAAYEIFSSRDRDIESILKRAEDKYKDKMES